MYTYVICGGCSASLLPRIFQRFRFKHEVYYL